MTGPPFRIDYHPEAIVEAREARDWYRAHSDRIATQFDAELRFALDLVEQRPLLHRRYVGATRRALLRSFPYMVVYEVRDELVQILAVAHCARRPGYWRYRLKP